MVVIAGCDANLKYHMFSCVSSGSTHDSMALEFSAFKTLLDDGFLPADYYIIGDEAFKCTDQFLVPWSGTGLGLWKDSFNFHLSRMRQVIERSFGVLTRRWGIFWRPLDVAFNKWSLIATVCAKLHNFCLDNNVPIADRAECDNFVGDEWEVVLNLSDVDETQEAPNRRPGGERRQRFTRMFQQEGIVRPRYASMNSRS
jgi:DDE superfamily endonuclease